MILILLSSSADLFSKLFFFKASFRKHYQSVKRSISRDQDQRSVGTDLFFQSIIQEHYQSVKRSVSRDQDQRSVGTDLGTNCLQRLSADNKSGR